MARPILYKTEAERQSARKAIKRATYLKRKAAGLKLRGEKDKVRAAALYKERVSKGLCKCGRETDGFSKCRYHMKGYYRTDRKAHGKESQALMWALINHRRRFAVDPLVEGEVEND